VAGTFGDFFFSTRHFWGFPLFRPALWGFPLYRPLDGKRTLSNASTVVENQTFGAGVTKNSFL